MNRQKNIKDSYFSLKGLGLFDLIPCVRDLPYIVKFILMVVTLIIIIGGISGLMVLLINFSR